MSVDAINATQTLTPNNSQLQSTDTAKHIQELALVALLSVVSLVTVIGNTLVILAVITTRRLRTVTNCFVMSLAVADWLVGIFVLPPAAAYHFIGVWELGWILCDVWVSLDILLCTASILSLCAISVDRYLAVTQPLSYSRKRRSKRLAFTMILAVWISSALITCPPMFGWYEPGRHNDKTCRYNKNTGYVIFSAMGSFFIPMVVMLYVYVRISCVVAQRHDQLAHLDRQTKVLVKTDRRIKTSVFFKIYNITQKSHKLVLNPRDESDIDRGSSEYEEPNVRCVNAGGGDAHSNNHTEPRKSMPTTNSSRSLRPNYTLEPSTPQRSSSLYRTTSLSTPTPGRTTRPESLDVSVLNYEPTTRVSSFRRETKTAQTLSIVVGGFIACWLPFFIYYILTPFLPNSNQVVMGYLTWLGWINSAINPFIYAFYSPDFRIAFWRLTFKHFSKPRRPDFAFQHK